MENLNAAACFPTDIDWPEALSLKLTRPAWNACKKIDIEAARNAAFYLAGEHFADSDGGSFPNQLIVITAHREPMPSLAGLGSTTAKETIAVLEA